MRVTRLVLSACLGATLHLAGSVASSASPPNSLTNIAQCLENVRDTNGPCPVNLTATLTLLDRPRNLLVLQDASGAMAINLPLTNYTLQPGQLVSLQGACMLPYIRSFPDYPDRPTGWDYPSTFEVPLGTGNFYLTRLRGYLRPPVTGEYTFWIAADDAGELWLSPDADPDHAKRICGLPIGSSTGRREWTRFAAQHSSTIKLKAGEKYYIEAIQMQGVGPDCLAVAWDGPDLPRAVIEGRYLSPWENPGEEVPPPGAVIPANGILREYWNNYYVRNFFPLHYRSPRESIVRIRDLKLAMLEESPVPAPCRLAPGDTPDLTNDFRWTETEGLVSFAAASGRRLQLELSKGKSVLKAEVFNWSTGPVESLKNSRVRLRGVSENTLSLSNQIMGATLWVPDPEHITLLPPTGKDWSEVSSALISEVEPSNPAMSWGRQIKVRGRLVRRDGASLLLQGSDIFEGFYSADGTNWVRIGKPMEIGMSNTVYVGLAVASHQPADVATAKFDFVAGPGTNWVAADLNTPVFSGTAFSQDGSTLTVTGGGRRIASTTDHCYFLYQPMDGEGEIVARLTDFESGDRMAQAGLMIRESLDRGALIATVLNTPAHGSRFQYRNMPGAYAVQFDPPQETKDAKWMKIIRRKSSLPVRAVTASEVPDGSEIDVVGTLVWEKGSPVLTEATYSPVDPGIARPSVAMGGLRRLRNISIQQFLDEAQQPSQPYLRGYLEVAGLRGVITFCDPIFSPNTIFFQAGNSGLSIAWPDTNFIATLQVGQLVDVSGRSVAGQFPVTLEPATLTVMGWGAMPVPTEYSGDRLASRSRHAQWVQVEGVVHSSGRSNMLNIMCREGLLTARVGRNQSASLRETVNALVRARGVLSLRPGDDPVLLIPSPTYLEIKEQPPADPFAIPAFTIHDLTSLNVKPENQRQMKVAGTVTCIRPKGLFVQDDSGGALVQMTEKPSVKIGDRIEAVGFPEGRSSLVLTEALVRKTGSGQMPAPVSLPIRSEEEGNYVCSLVHIEATVVEQRNRADNRMLILQAGSRIYEAALALNAEEAGPLPTFTPGSRVAVTGVCQAGPGGELAGTDQTAEEPVAASLRIWLRSPADVVLLNRPPWWNWKYAAIIVCLFACGLLGALLWVRMLRRRVAQRTRELGATMARLEQETHTSAVLAERDRLAGEIHDSLEQGLTAIMLQLDAAAKLAHNPEEVRRYLGLARSMAGFSRAEVQHAVWDLQSPLLQDADLGQALAHVASEISSGDAQKVTVNILGQVRPLTSSVEHHLLRIGQEAITNAVKHAHSLNIQVTLVYFEDKLRLSVTDDGNGFVPDTVLQAGKDGHFGLQGIRGRSRKINAELAITSQPGQGATIAVTVPLNGNVHTNG